MDWAGIEPISLLCKAPATNHLDHGTVLYKNCCQIWMFHFELLIFSFRPTLQMFRFLKVSILKKKYSQACTASTYREAFRYIDFTATSLIAVHFTWNQVLVLAAEMCSCYSCMCQQFVRPSVSCRQLFKLFPFNFLVFWLCYIYLSEQGKGSSTSSVFLLIHTFHDGQLLCPTRRIELSVEGFFFSSRCSNVLFKLCKKVMYVNQLRHFF